MRYLIALLALSQAAGCILVAPAHELLYDLNLPRPNLRHRLDHGKRDFPNASAVTQAFEVGPPVLGPGGTVIGAGRPDPFSGDIALDPAVAAGGSSCTVRLVDNVFGLSFDLPALFDYTPPSCVGDANTALTNLTVQTIGRQFDRLSFVFLGDVEILRWSTAEPRRDGVQWTAIKDVSQYMELWREPQKVIFDLGNLLNENLTGTYNLTWDVTFFQAPAETTLPTADVIIPISSKEFSKNQTNPQPSTFNTAETSETWVIVEDFPRNARKAVVTIQSDGQIDDEFWYGNFPTSTALAFNATGNPNGGNTAYREIRLYIDDQVAGIQAPFPIIFSGGLNPAFWSPVVGIDLFDEKETEIDISPFLPVLCDGNAHNFTIRVFGLEDDGPGQSTGRFTRFFNGTFGSYWQLTGKIFVWTEADSSFTTTGSAPTIDIPEPQISINQALTTNATGANETLTYSVSVSRSITVTGSINTPNGTVNASWAQTIQTTNDGLVTDFGNTSTFNFQTDVRGVSSRAGVTQFSTAESYPITVNATVFTLPNATVETDISFSRAKSVERAVANRSTSDVFPSGLQVFSAIVDTAQAVAGFNTLSLQTAQNGQGRRLVFPGGGSQNGSFSTATTDQTVTFSGSGAGSSSMELYSRDVSVTSDGTIVSDTEKVAGQVVPPGRAGLTFPTP